MLRGVADVRCSSEAGWFMPGMARGNPDPDSLPVDYISYSEGRLDNPQVADGYARNIELMDTFLPSRCVAAHEGESWKCKSVHNIYPSVEAPMYIVEDEFDTSVSGQLGRPKGDVFDAPLGPEWIAYLGESMRNSTNQVYQKQDQDGLFRLSCMDHGSFVGRTINGYTHTAGLGDWFNDRIGVPRILEDDCSRAPPGLPCNCLSTSPCQVAANAVCVDSDENLDVCYSCLRANQQELKQAGCSREEVKSLCESIVSR